ncbi:MAG: alkaline phosphatase [Prevotellaceae bacterium]|jgi:alkaline phosphatase|nr:alkaline phosphatase [Prevotellaceae bacterium]
MKKLSITILCIVMIFGACFAQNNKKAKYIFLFIGDGMGISHVTLTEAYLADKAKKIGSEYLSFSKFPYTGFATTYSASHFTTCSSAAGTAFATGYKTKNHMLGIAPDSVTKFKSISYKLKEKGLKIGVSSNVGINHATPASFYANNVSRTAYYEIGLQLWQSGFDFFGGGSFLQDKGKTKDLQSLEEITINNGYVVTYGIKAANEIPANVEKVAAFFNENINVQNLSYAINRKEGEAKLSDIVEAEIKFLKAREDKGFFIMAEGGIIDWCAHDNDAAGTVKEVIDLSEAVQVAVDFYNEHPDETLIIVTADHETGGITLARTGGGKHGFASLDGQTGSFGTLGKERGRAICDSINNAAGVGFSTIGHTGIVVPVYAIGAGAELFTGKFDNTDIPRKIMQAAGFEF